MVENAKTVGRQWKDVLERSMWSEMEIDLEAARKGDVPEFVASCFWKDDLLLARLKLALNVAMVL